MKRTKRAKPSKLACALILAGLSDRACGELAGMGREIVCRIKLGQRLAALHEALALERVLTPYIRAEDLPLDEKAKQELAELRSRGVSTPATDSAA